MCGFVGILSRDPGREIPAALLHAMNASQHHRGPDSGAVHREPGVGLGHRRLAIIDVTGGAQPLWNEDETVVVVYNGELYDWAPLARELEAAGHVFRTRCDTEVIVHAWEEWGEACVERFRGMFAFAIWDRNRQTLFLARDRLGIKPVHYAELPNGDVIFGSELKALYAHPDLPRARDPLAVEEYFAFGYVPEPRTILASARKLPPGHTLAIRRGQPLPAPVEYWDVPFAALPPSDEAAVCEELMRRVEEAVRIRLVAEVPLGAFLSGGIDSSAVVAMMSRASDDPVKTCSISFGDPRFNESAYAAQVADLLHTDHRVHQVEPDDFDLIDRLASLYDEPYADSSAMPTYRVCQLARERVTVALSGDGGDENLAGYRRYRLHANEERVRGLAPLGLRRAVFGTLGRVYPKADWAPRVLRAKSTFQGLARDTVDAYFHTVSILGDDMRRALFSEGFRRSLNGYGASQVMRDHAARAPTPAGDGLALAQYLDMKTYLPGDILTKVDRASMAHSLEVRVPLLDHKLVEWISGLPSDLKLRAGEGKYVFKKALEKTLPHDILYRRKMGFAVPLATWFRGPLRDRVREALLGERMADSGVFDMQTIRRLVDRHASGVGDHSAALWSLLMFEAHLRQVGDR
ncbi:MAG: amidotransferase 1, exosortase A system-associated [Chromatiales bacterium]|nr:amidotransferase 1, exosortase A system-associated [Chromatiales bacterium]